MSTYYELYCEETNLRCNGASRTLGGCCHLIDSEKVLPHFIVAHSEYPIRILSEYEDVPKGSRLVLIDPDPYVDEEISLDDMKNIIEVLEK